MIVNEENIVEVNLHLQEVAKALNLRPDDFPKLKIGDSDFDLDLDCADCVLDLGGFMERTMSIETLSYDDYAVRCGRFTQFFINIEDYYDGKIMGCLYWHFLNDDIKVKVVLCPFLIGLRNIKEQQYEWGNISPFADFTALEIEYSDESKRLNRTEELELVHRVLFFLDEKYDKEIKLKTLPRYYEDIDYGCGDYDEEQLDKTTEVSLSSLPQYTTMLKTYMQAKSTDDNQLRYLLYYKIIEYISPTVAKLELLERLNLKLDVLPICKSNISYLESIVGLVQAYDRSQSDNELVKTVLLTCADLVDLQDFLPIRVKERMQSDAKFGKNVRWTYENIKPVEDSMKITLGQFLYSTRNSIVHAKSNYNKTGFECEGKDLEQFNLLLKRLCYSIIMWSSRHNIS